MNQRKITITITDCLYCPNLISEDFKQDEPVWVCQLKNQVITKDKLGYLPIPDFCPLDPDEDNRPTYTNARAESVQSEPDTS